jgi:DNA-binding NtrC family response regulator
MLEKTYLIVDDAEDIREPFVRFLTRRGFKKVMAAAKAKDALEKIEKEKPDLILLDIQLEDEIDGVEILKRTKEGLSPTSHVVMLSGHKDAYEEKCMGLGALQFWGKPMDPHAMLEGIKKIFPS